MHRPNVRRDDPSWAIYCAHCGRDRRCNGTHSCSRALKSSCFWVVPAGNADMGMRPHLWKLRLLNKVAVRENKSSPNKSNEKSHSFHTGTFFLFLFFETNENRTETSPASAVYYFIFLWQLLKNISLSDSRYTQESPEFVSFRPSVHRKHQSIRFISISYFFGQCVPRPSLSCHITLFFVYLSLQISRELVTKVIRVWSVGSFCIFSSLCFVIMKCCHINVCASHSAAFPFSICFPSCSSDRSQLQLV